MKNNLHVPLTTAVLKHLGYTYDGTTKSYTHPEEILSFKYEHDKWQLYHDGHWLRPIQYIDTMIDVFRLLGTGWALLTIQLQEFGYS